MEQPQLSFMPRFSLAADSSREPSIPELFWNSCDGMMVIDGQRRVIAVNPALKRWVGFKAEEPFCGSLLGCRDFQGCPLSGNPGQCPGLRAFKDKLPIHSAEYVIQSAEGKSIPVSASYTPIQLGPERSPLALVILRDMSIRRRWERRLLHQAMTDSLTGLPNRASFLEAARRELTRARRIRHGLAIALIDLDGLKHYNDSAGHAAGDALLRAVARVLNLGHRAGEMVARYGGDEFALLLTDADATAAMAAVERLRKAVADFPFARRLGECAASFSFPVTVSIGAAVFPTEAATLENLLAIADGRLYEAKRHGRNRVMGPDLAPERRRCGRISLQARALLQNPPEETESAVQEAAVANISLSGAYVTLPEDHRLRLEHPVLFVIEIPQAYRGRFPFSRICGHARVTRLDHNPVVEEQAQPRVGVALSFDREPSLSAV